MDRKGKGKMKYAVVFEKEESSKKEDPAGNQTRFHVGSSQEHASAAVALPYSGDLKKVNVAEANDRNVKRGYIWPPPQVEKGSSSSPKWRSYEGRSLDQSTHIPRGFSNVGHGTVADNGVFPAPHMEEGTQSSLDQTSNEDSLNPCRICPRKLSIFCAVVGHENSLRFQSRLRSLVGPAKFINFMAPRSGQPELGFNNRRNHIPSSVIYSSLTQLHQCQVCTGRRFVRCALLGHENLLRFQSRLRSLMVQPDQLGFTNSSASIFQARNVEGGNSVQEQEINDGSIDLLSQIERGNRLQNQNHDRYNQELHGNVDLTLRVGGGHGDDNNEENNGAPDLELRVGRKPCQ